MKFAIPIMLLPALFSLPVIACPNLSGHYKDGQGLDLSYDFVQQGCSTIDVDVVDKNGLVIDSFTENIDGKFRHDPALGEDIMYAWDGNKLNSAAYENPDAGGWGFHRVTSSLTSQGDLQIDELFLQGDGYSGKSSYTEKHF